MYLVRADAKVRAAVAEIWHMACHSRNIQKIRESEAYVSRVFKYGICIQKGVES